MTWNVCGSAQPDISALATVIRTESPDVVVLQEIGEAQAEALATALVMRYTWARKHSPARRLGRGRAEGLAMMTPHALGAPGHTEITEDQPGRSPSRQIAQWALIGRPDRTMAMVFNLLLSSHDDAEARWLEAHRVRGIVESIGDEQPVIVAGHLNDADEPMIIAELPGIEHLMPAPTSPSATPERLLDHVVLPVDATDIAVTVPAGGPAWAALSGHLPVTARFAITSGV